MRPSLYFPLAAIPVFAYPLDKQRCDLWQTWPGQIYSYNPATGYTNFTFPCTDCWPNSPHSALVLQSDIQQDCDLSANASCLTLTLGDQIVPVSSGQDSDLTSDALVIGSTGLQLEHGVSTHGNSDWQSVNSTLFIFAIDSNRVNHESGRLSINVNITAGKVVTTLIDLTAGGMAVLDKAQSHCSLDPPPYDLAEEQYLADEIETIRLLEQDVIRLQHEISIRKNAASTRLAQYHEKISLDELMQHCDNIACTAKVLANRVYEKLTLALSSNTEYDRLQNPINSNYTHERTSNSSHTQKDFPTMEHGSTDFFLRALSFIASLIGLSSLVFYIRMKCMSVRTRTERAADREERKTSRAYRRAARRAEMRRRWTAFARFFSVHRCKEELSTSDYDEKRALILQDALLEERPELLEKGDLMEAEIRQLRHASTIIDGILRSDNSKAGLALAKDPPPPLVPLPPSSLRSRSSTGTLPSYNSESLPDYSSTPEDYSSDERVCDGFRHYQPPASDAGSSDYAPHHSPRIIVTHGSTPISSVAGISPRASAETLRTRTTLRSRAGSRDLP